MYMLSSIKFVLALSVVTTLLLGCNVQVKPAQLPDIEVVKYKFANVGKPPYVWYNQGIFLAEALDTQDSPTTFSRYTIEEDGLGGTRSEFAIIDGWLCPTREVSITRLDVSLDWTEFAWQEYQGQAKQLPQFVMGPGSVSSSGDWTWHNTDGATAYGTWQYAVTWRIDGGTLISDEVWTQSDSNQLTTTSHFVTYQDQADGMFGFDELVNSYTACISTRKCQ